MDLALSLLLVQGVLGAWDTLWYHEWVYRLPARHAQTFRELRLHAVRDFVYAVLFLSLPFVVWQGAWAWVLLALLGVEVLVTLCDFVIEDRVRAPFGGVAPGERCMHAVMAIVYGAFLASFLPFLIAASREPTGWQAIDESLPVPGYVFVVMGIGVLGSGVRDLGASFAR